MKRWKITRLLRWWFIVEPTLCEDCKKHKAKVQVHISGYASERLCLTCHNRINPF